jgi:hypothetical protein
MHFTLVPHQTTMVGSSVVNLLTVSVWGSTTSKGMSAEESQNLKVQILLFAALYQGLSHCPLRIFRPRHLPKTLWHPAEAKHYFTPTGHFP